MKAALVTGSSKGIGRAIALLLKSKGFFVYVHGRNVSDLEVLEKELEQKNSVLVADLGKPSEVDRLALEFKGRLKSQGHQLKTLVNNAAIFRRHSASEARQDHWQDQVQVNLLAPTRLTELLIPELKEAGGSCVVNIASTLGVKPAENVTAYSATKAALINWTQGLALELGPFNIRVNCVSPGLVDTPIHDFHRLPPDEKAAMKQKMAGLQPLGRIGEPEDIAAAVAFLASEDSVWTTGAVLSVDGGINLK